MAPEILYNEASYRIMGACFEEQECLGIEFEERMIFYEEKRELELTHKGRKLRKRCEPDFVCFDKIVVELKVVSACRRTPSSAFNYLKATKIKLGLLVNFGGYPKLDYERIVN